MQNENINKSSLPFYLTKHSVLNDVITIRKINFETQVLNRFQHARSDECFYFGFSQYKYSRKCNAWKSKRDKKGFKKKTMN